MLKQFFSDVLPENNSYKLAWTLDDKKSHWFQDVNNLIEFILFKKENVFFGLGVTDKQLTQYKRADAADVTSIRVLHLDIDIKSEAAHKNEILPTTIEEAKAIAYKFCEPTYLVNSGHGLHAYWLFNEHQKIDNHEWWTLLIQAWQQAHQKAFPQYKLDATFDLARILRCPESINCKDPENPIKCEIIEYNETAYYELEEFEDAINFDPDEALKIQRQTNHNTPADSPPGNSLRRLTKAESRVYITTNGLTLTADNSINTDVYMRLQGMEPEFHEEMTNTTGRKSASEYQFRLAHIAIKHGLSDQETLDIMVQHRRHNRHDLQMDRPEKYINDLLKAKRTYNIKRINKTPKKKLTANDLESVREYLYSMLNIQVKTLWKFRHDPDDHFELELLDVPGKTIYLGTLKDGIMNQRNFDARIISATMTAPNRLKDNKWYDEIVQKLMLLVVDGISPQTATYEGQVSVWAKEYFFNKDISENITSHFDNGVLGNPFYHKNRIYFSYETLVQWIKTNKGENIDVFHFGIAMTKNGFIHDTVKDKNGNNLQLWATPPGYLEEDARKQPGTAA